MREIDANSLLLQMRAMAARASAEPTSVNQQVGAAENSDFMQMMRNAIDEVNKQQQASSHLTAAFEKGDPNVDIAEVMIQMQKANVSFEAITQVRNRLVSAYQDIMNMPI